MFTFYATREDFTLSAAPKRRQSFRRSLPHGAKNRKRLIGLKDRCSNRFKDQAASAKHLSCCAHPQSSYAQPSHSFCGSRRKYQVSTPHTSANAKPGHPGQHRSATGPLLDHTAPSSSQRCSSAQRHEANPPSSCQRCSSAQRPEANSPSSSQPFSSAKPSGSTPHSQGSPRPNVKSCSRLEHTWL